MATHYLMINIDAELQEYVPVQQSCSETEALSLKLSVRFGPFGHR